MSVLTVDIPKVVIFVGLVSLSFTHARVCWFGHMEVSVFGVCASDCLCMLHIEPLPSTD